jgi:hypothetical protein
MKNFPAFSLSHFILIPLLMATPLLSGCWAAVAYDRMNGHTVAAQYNGIASHSVAIVVYADDATLWEYASAREDVSAFIAQRLRMDIPTCRLVNYRDVAQWQDETLHWEALQVKDIGKHFSVDRVIYIELLEYSAHEPGASDLLRGRIRASAKVYETNTPGDNPAWHGQFETFFPTDGPADISRTNELTVRKMALEFFSKKVVDCFYDHNEKEPLLRDRDNVPP